MIKKFELYKSLNEGRYEELVNSYNSLGEYIEHLSTIVDNKEEFSRILGENLKIRTKKYNSKKYDKDDYVLMEYWWKDIITPVKILEKNHGSFKVTHNIPDSELQNAPDEIIKKGDIIDFYHKYYNDLEFKKIDTSLRISKAVNAMNPYDQMLLVKKIEDTFAIGESIEFNNKGESIKVLGKTGFNTFGKILSALSVKKIEPSIDKCPKNFYNYFLLSDINTVKFLNIIKRFKSLNSIIEPLESHSGNISLYYGIKYYKKNIIMEYGIFINERNIILGHFKLNKSTINSLSNINNKSIRVLVDNIKDIKINDIKKLMIIKNDMDSYSPSHHISVNVPSINSGVVMYSYNGAGTWKEGLITSKSFNDIKTDFKNWVLTKKWAKDIVFNISAKDFWLHIKIKFK